MKTTTTLVSVFAVFAIAGMTVLSGCGVGEASVSDDDAVQAAVPVPVEIALVHRADIYATYQATAAISSDADAPVVARVGGELVKLLVEEGDSVTAGQVLARLDGRRLRLEMLAAKANLAKATRDYERNADLNERGLISASMYEGLKYDLAALEATYKLAQLNYDYSNIRATIAGVVSSREIKPGQTVNVDEVAFRITDPSELVAYLQIPQSQLTKFEAGQIATVQVASMPGIEYPASIVRISPTIDTRNGTFRATAVIQNSKGELAPGMFGQFTIAYEKHSNVLVVPSAALLDEDEQSTVYVVSDGQVSRRVVEKGIEANGEIEILGGLTENEQVVVIGHSGLRDGSRVLASSALADSFSG